MIGLKLCRCVIPLRWLVYVFYILKTCHCLKQEIFIRGGSIHSISWFSGSKNTYCIYSTITNLNMSSSKITDFLEIYFNQGSTDRILIGSKRSRSHSISLWNVSYNFFFEKMLIFKLIIFSEFRKPESRKPIQYDLGGSVRLSAYNMYLLYCMCYLNKNCP